MACSSRSRSNNGRKLQMHSTQQGQIGMIAPTTTLTPTDAGYARDYWEFKTTGEQQEDKRWNDLQEQNNQKAR